MTSVIVGIGYGIMAITTPNEQQFYDALAPDLKRKVDDSRAYQKAAREKYDRLEALKAAGDREEPVWAEETPKK